MPKAAIKWSPAVLWWLCWAGFTVYLLLPGSERSPFSGLPLSSKASLLFSGLVVLAGAALLFGPRRQIHPAIPTLLWMVALAKPFLAPALIDPGWRGEYFQAQRTTSGAYTAYKRAYFQDGLTARPYRVDRSIDFEGTNFGLTFVNDMPPKARDWSAYERERYPLIVRWTGHVDQAGGAPVRASVSATGSVIIRVDGKEVFRRNNPSQDLVSWVSTQGRHTVEVTYWKPESLKPAISIAPFAVVTPVHASAEDVRHSAMVSRTIDIIGWVGLALLALAFVSAFRPAMRFMMEDVWLEPDKLVLLALFAMFFAGAFLHTIPKRHATIQLGIGDDALRYEGAAREILRNGVLMLPDEGPAEPYYHYPFYSYILAVAHVVWGDDYASSIVLNYHCTALVIVLLWMIVRTRLARGSIVFLLILFGIFAKNHLLHWAQQPFTDNLYVPATIATILATIVGYEKKSARWLFLAGILTALGAATRPSMLLHLPVMALAILLYRDLGSFVERVRCALAFVLGFAAGVAPFTLRNWIVSRRFVLLVASFVMLPYFMYMPGEQIPSFIVDGKVPSGLQAIAQAWDVFEARPVKTVVIEIRKVLFTLGFTHAGPPELIGTVPWHLPLFPLLFALALLTRRIERPVAAALLTFSASHLLAMIVGTPWTYGYKTILPFHVAAIIGAAFLLPRRGEFSIPTARERPTPAPLPDRVVSVVLPTYNEKDSIRTCVQDFFATGVVDEVLVINNNAAEGTSAEVAGTGAVEIFEPRQGYGAAIQRGLQEARGDYIVVSEPDGTFLAGDIHKLLAYAGDFDVVYGSRTSQQMVWKGANMGVFLRWGNWAVAKYMEFIYNATSLTDVGCTMRLISKEAAQALLPQFRIAGSQFGPEMMVLSLQQGFRVIQIPVHYLPRVGQSAVTGEPGKAFLLGLRMLWLITTHRLKQLKTPPGPGARAIRQDA